MKALEVWYEPRDMFIVPQSYNVEHCLLKASYYPERELFGWVVTVYKLCMAGF